MTERPVKEDFIVDCSSCHGVGSKSYRVRVGGWAGHHEIVSEECTTCRGKGVVFNKDGYILALEEYIDQIPLGFREVKQASLQWK